MRARIAAVMASRSLVGWQGAIDTPDACITPVLSASAAATHPHVVARGTLVATGGALNVAPAPRFQPARAAVDRARTRGTAPVVR